MINRIYILAFVILLFSSCDKEQPPIDRTDVLFEVERDLFYDTLYTVSNLNITSSNDEILNSAHVKLIDGNDSTVEILSGSWKEMRGKTFGLPERRYYNLELEVFLPDAPNEILAKDYIGLDNFNYPDYLKITNIELDPNIISQVSNNGETVSNNHITLLEIKNDFDFIFGSTSINTSGNPPTDSEEYYDDENIIYHSKSYPPKKINFNTDIQLPITTFDDKFWKIYEVFLGYQLVINSSPTQVRSLSFKISIIDLINELGTEANTTFTINEFDSTDGGMYTGTLKFEWIYE